MDDEHKKRVMKAIEAFTSKHQPKTVGRTRRRNNKPEKEVEKTVLTWMRSNGFDVDVIEAKASYSLGANRYLHSPVPPGFSDIAGNFRNGLAVYVELKAPGSATKSKLRADQRAFLVRKLNSGAFAVVVDSVESLQTLWTSFLESTDKRGLLLRALP